MDYRNHYLLSRPVELHWAGWHTDTYRLQQAGWSLSAHENVHNMTMQMALRNERAGIYGVTGEVRWDYFANTGHEHSRAASLPVLPVKLMSRNVDVLHYGGALPEFAAIDAQPQISTRTRVRLEDFAHFAPAHSRTQQIIVPEDTVDDLMARILEMQHGPRIERIREEIAEGERIHFTDRQKFHAQIVSIAS